MSAISGDLFNLTKNENAILVINGLENTSFFLTNFRIPSISIGVANRAMPFKEHNEPGDKLTFGELQATFAVDEYFQNWKEINDWIRSMTNGYGFLEDNEIQKKSASIILYTNSMNPFAYIRFLEIFPTQLDEVEFDLQTADPTIITCQVTFEYQRYDIDIPSIND